MICSDAVIATISNMWGYGYEMMYSDYWDFDIQSADKEISLDFGERIKVTHTKLNYELLQRYHNMVIKEYCYSDLNENVKDVYIHHINSGHPIMTSYKEQYMPWDNRYTNVGFLLFYDYNKVSDEFLCIDVHNTKKNHILPGNILEKGILWNHNISLGGKINGMVKKRKT